MIRFTEIWAKGCESIAHPIGCQVCKHWVKPLDLGVREDWNGGGVAPSPFRIQRRGTCKAREGFWAADDFCSKGEL